MTLLFKTLCAILHNILSISHLKLILRRRITMILLKISKRLPKRPQASLATLAAMLATVDAALYSGVQHVETAAWAVEVGLESWQLWCLLRDPELLVYFVSGGVCSEFALGLLVGVLTAGVRARHRLKCYMRFGRLVRPGRFRELFSRRAPASKPKWLYPQVFRIDSLQIVPLRARIVNVEVIARVLGLNQTILVVILLGARRRLF